MRFECEWYDPCPICSKCRAVADNIYYRCLKCVFSVQRCKHSSSDIEKIIKRKNFTLKLTTEGKARLGELIHEQRRETGGA